MSQTSCPLCYAEIKMKNGLNYVCNICKTRSATLRRGKHISDKEALQKWNTTIQERQDEVMNV